MEVGVGRSTKGPVAGAAGCGRRSNSTIKKTPSWPFRLNSLSLNYSAAFAGPNCRLDRTDL